ncbi:MAG: cytochrome D oxidase subunit I [Candidatus Sumerlaea sp.]|uniref:Cytochrome d ubiquinol oxidase subunit II n=1 Tax=Sumerlaea chitinivorans TaxID=2250252 RepID=A0A2Z4Y670_SUMC1|nr:Cytochrome d ubiquinol oxidase subunit II [Candidatus Sumerlaea chitinivorans]GIX45592.1 MAG: cytochrome D oxidase subunit I [Candidatus Sumerlaea sp.]
MNETGMLDLNLLWYFLVGALLTGYAVLDGFDLGVGTLHLFARTDLERRILMNSIGPVWDGNEVWLVTAGGALFAAFPKAYATAFSGFYLAFMILLWALIFRAVALEFRSKRPSRVWRNAWDVAFFLASTVSSFLFGVAVGNMMQGLPIGPDGEYAGTLIDLLTPYPILVGVFNVAMFAMHGAIYLYLKTEGELQERVRGWIWRAYGTFLFLYVLTTIVTLIQVPNATRNFRDFPWVWAIVILTVLAIANIPRAVYHGYPVRALISSGCAMAGLIFLFGIALFPNLIISTISPEYNLTAYTAASSQKTLGIMAIMAAIGMPFVLGYTSIIYWIFRGKVKLDKMSY